MKAPAEFTTRLRRAASEPQDAEANAVIREAQADAYRAGYAQAADDLFGIAQASQERVDNLLAQAGVSLRR